MLSCWGVLGWDACDRGGERGESEKRDFGVVRR